MSPALVVPVVGTAGWALGRAAADRLPPDGTHLQRYGTRLNGVEINSSFYRPHRQATYARWAASVPDRFRFAVKVPRSVTHERRLVGCADLLDRFAGEIAGLGHKLGPMLVQLPPRLAFDPGVAATFLTLLQERIPGAIVCEPRHPSWFAGEADELFKEKRVARVAADPPPAAGADEPGGSETLVYFRLHGSPAVYASAYDDEALVRIGRRLTNLAGQGIPTWCVFDNTALGHALGNALKVADRTGASTHPLKRSAAGPA